MLKNSLQASAQDLCTEGERQHIKRRASGVWGSRVCRDVDGGAFQNQAVEETQTFIQDSIQINHQ